MISKHNDKPRNPNDLLVGVCGTCKTNVLAARWQCRSRTGDRGLSSYDGQPWDDVPWAPCPRCGAGVPVMVKHPADPPKPESRRFTTKDA